MNCQACNQNIIYNSEILRCSKCKQKYHYACLNMTSAYYMSHKPELERSWSCPPCGNVTRRARNDNTPVRKQFQHITNDPDMSTDCVSDDDQGIKTPPPANIQPQNETLTTNHFTMDEFSKLLDQKLETNKKSLIIDLKNTIESEINKAISKLRQELIQHTSILKIDQEKIKTDILKIDQKIERLELDNEKLKKQIQEFRKHDHNKIAADYSKKIVLYGLNEYYRESEHDLHSRIINAFHDILDINIAGYLDEAKRIGKQGQRQQRPVVIEFISRRCTNFILQNAKQFRNTGLAICEYLDEQSLQTRRKLREGLISARKSGHHAIIRKNLLIVDGKIMQTQATTTINDVTIKSMEPEPAADNTLNTTNASTYNFRDQARHV